MALLSTESHDPSGTRSRMMSDVVVAYSRHGERYYGTVLLDGVGVWAAQECSFADIITAASRTLRQRPTANLIFRRLDRRDLNDLPIVERDRDVIRDNPDLYLEASGGFDRRVVVRERDEVTPVMPEDTSASLMIRSGYDTLAEAFGDSVYVRLRDDGKVECPLCGRWTASIQEAQPTTADTEEQRVLSCFCTPVGFFIEDVVGAWVEIETRTLLHTRATRFYLPRAWNDSGSWITFADLVDCYDTFLKEVKHVREQTS